MATPYLGQIIIFAGTFTPVGYLPCQGQPLPISTFESLYDVIGTTYGGDGVTTFALPDLRSRAPLHVGQGTGLSFYTLGEMTGQEGVTLTTAQMATHNHNLSGDATVATAMSPQGGNLAETSNGGRPFADSYTTGTPSQPVQLTPTTIGATGGNQAHPNIQPVIAINYIIATQGVYPTRS